MGIDNSQLFVYHVTKSCDLEGGMNIDQLPYLRAIAAEGNPSAAARKLGVSQQAISKYLNELEREVGLELFFRSNRQYLPTPAGRLYLQTAQRVLDLKRHTFEALASLDRQAPAALRLGVSPNRGIETMAHIYPFFDRRYPYVHLDLSEGYANQLMELLQHGQLDAVMSTYTGTAPAGCQALPIHNEELVLAVPSFHPLVKHTAARLEELPYAELRDFEDTIFIQPRPSSNLHGLVQALFEREGFHPQIVSSLPNMQLQLAMIRGGTRVAILPSYYVRPDPEIAFFRLYNSPLLTMVYMTRSGHQYPESERYLVWLMLRMKYEEALLGIQWSETLRAIDREFGPVEGGGLV